VSEISKIPPSNETPLRLCDNKIFLHTTLKLSLKYKVLILLSGGLSKACTGLRFDVIITIRNNVIFVSDDANQREIILFTEWPYEHPVSMLLL
jgi:hypothetical protein